MKTTEYRTIGWIDKSTDEVQLDYCSGPPGDDREWRAVLSWTNDRDRNWIEETCAGDPARHVVEVTVTEWDDGTFTIT